MKTTAKKTNSIQCSIKKVENIEDVKSAWLSLELQSTPSFFLTWSWIGPWAKLVSDSTDLYLFNCDIDGKNTALCFITLSSQKRFFNLVSSKQVHLNESLLEDYNMVLQYNNILVEDSHKNEVWAYFLKALDEWKISWDEINIRSVSQDSYNKINNTSSKYKQILYREDVSWCVPLSDDIINFDDLLGKFKRKSRQQLKQSIKEYNKIGEITWEVAGSIEEALDYFNKMELLHTERWAKVEIDGAFANNKWVKFNKDVITEAFPKGEILLIKIICESNVLGYLYGFLHGTTAYMYQTGFTNTTNNKLRSGYISHISAMIYCSKNNIKSYDFLPDPIDSYKKFFAESGESIYHLRLQRIRLKFIFENSIRFLHSNLKSLFSKDK